jgi:hypothetical protein
MGTRFENDLAANDIAEDAELDEIENEDDDERLKRVSYRVTPTGKGLKTFAIVAGIILLVSGIVLIILSLTVHSSTIHLESVTLFRTGNPATGFNVDALPAPDLKALNRINITLIYGFAQVFAGIGLLLMYFLFGYMLNEMAYGSDGYMWAAVMLATLLYDVVIALRCGLQDLTVLIFDGMLHFSILSLFWVGDLLNQHFYRSTMQRLGVGRFSYAFLVLAAIVFVAVWGMQLVALFFAISGTTGAPTTIIIVPLIAVVFYVVLFVVVGLHYGGVTWFAETYSRDLAISIVVFITVLVVPWIDVILFFSISFVNTAFTTSTLSHTHTPAPTPF